VLGKHWSQADGERLHALLLHHNAAPLEWVDGYFSALVVRPATVAPSEYLPALWENGELPVWESDDEASASLTLLMDYWNHITWRVSQPVPDTETQPDASLGSALLPYFSLPEIDDDAFPKAMQGAALDRLLESDGADVLLPAVYREFPYGAMWTRGFMAGQALRQEAWADWLEQHEAIFEDWLRLIPLARMDNAAESDAVQSDAVQSADTSSGKALDFMDRVGLTILIPSILARMNLQRFIDSRPQPTRRTDPKIGRNDPCACGSGKKFKQCCWTTASAGTKA